MRASDPLIINRLKRNDSVFDKVTVNDNYFGKIDQAKHQIIKEEVDEEDKPTQQLLLQSQDSNIMGEDAVYFKNLKPSAAASVQSATPIP